VNDYPELPASGFVTPQWVKRRYAISNSTLYVWLADKDNSFPKAHRIGPRAVRFRVEDLREFEAKLLARNGEAR
jgi:predicted DNA-binding transcriptional regulator AlpA